MVYSWPPGIAPPRVGFNGRGMAVAGPTSLTGRSQTAASDAGYWVATLPQMRVAGAAKVKLWRAFQALLSGGAGEVRVPAWEGELAPWPGTARTRDPIPHDDGALFSDGSGYSQPVIAVITDGAAAVRATSLNIDVGSAGDVEPGMLFSIDDRLYKIVQVLADDGLGNMNLAIWPPLREAVPDNATLNFDAPVCRMKLAQEGADDLVREIGDYGFPDLSFVESF